MTYRLEYRMGSFNRFKALCVYRHHHVAVYMSIDTVGPSPPSIIVTYTHMVVFQDMQTSKSSAEAWTKGFNFLTKQFIVLLFIAYVFQFWMRHWQF